VLETKPFAEQEGLSAWHGCCSPKAGMTRRSVAAGAEPIEGRLEVDRPIEYLAYERDGIRHAWTVEADDAGRYHALTLRWEEDAGGWVVTVAQPFDTVDAARARAERLDHEGEDATR
jgi:hypothetical protein